MEYDKYKRELRNEQKYRKQAQELREHNRELMRIIRTIQKVIKGEIKHYITKEECDKCFVGNDRGQAALCGPCQDVIS